MHYMICMHSLVLAQHRPGIVMQSVTSPTADPGVVSSIHSQPHTFVEIDHEIISTGFLLRGVGVTARYNLKYVHKVLVNYLVCP